MTAWGPYVNQLCHALSLLPPVSATTVFRGRPVSVEEESSTFVAGKTILFCGVTSCSLDVDEAIRRAGPGGTVLVIRGVTCKSIAPWSFFGDLEAEVIFAPGTAFLVTQGVSFEGDIPTIHLHEVTGERVIS